MAEMELEVKFTGDSSGAVKSVDQVSDSVKDLKTNSDEASESLQSTTTSTEGLSSSLTDSAAASEDAASGLNSTKESAEGAANAMGDAANKADELAEKKGKFGEFLTAMDGLEKASKKLGRELSAVVTGPIAAIATISLKNLYDKGALEGSSFAARDFALAVQGLLKNFKDTSLELGQRLMPYAMKLIGIFNTLIDAYRNLSPQTQDLVIKIGLIAAAIGPALLAFSTLTSVLLKLYPVFSAIVGVLTSPVVVIGTVIAAIAGLINVFVKLKSVGIDSVVALQLTLNLFATGFMNFVVGNLLDGLNLIIKGVSKVATYIAPGLKKGLDEASATITEWSGDLRKKFDDAKQPVDTALASIGTSAGDAFTFGLSTSLSQMGDDLQKAIDKAGSNIHMDKFTDAEKEAQLKAFRDAEERWAQMEAATRQRAQAIGESISSNMTDAFTAFADGSKSAGEAFADFARQTVSNLVKIATQAAIMNALFPPGSPMGNMLGAFAAATATRSYATGGAVVGPGTGTSDSILANVSNGEYVIRAAAVKKYGRGLFDSLNGMTGGLPLPVVGRPSFADGGMVSTGTQAAPSVVIENNGTQKQVASTDFDPKTMVVTVVLEDIGKNGPISKSIQGNFGVKRGALG